MPIKIKPGYKLEISCGATTMTGRVIKILDETTNKVRFAFDDGGWENLDLSKENFTVSDKYVPKKNRTFTDPINGEKYKISGSERRRKAEERVKVKCISEAAANVVVAKKLIATTSSSSSSSSSSAATPAPILNAYQATTSSTQATTSSTNLTTTNVDDEAQARKAAALAAARLRIIGFSSDSAEIKRMRSDTSSATEPVALEEGEVSLEEGEIDVNSMQPQDLASFTSGSPRETFANLSDTFGSPRDTFANQQVSLISPRDTSGSPRFTM